MACFDLSAPFDTVNHTILKSLEHYFGLKVTAPQWLSCYVSDRLFSVQIGNNFSQTHTISFSLPQESILGPDFFSCYVSTLPEVIEQTIDTTISGYADYHAFNPSLHPRRYTGKKHYWITSEQVNDRKTEFITFGTSNLLSKKDLDSITVGAITVNCSKTVTFPGAYLDETLSFRQHVVTQAKLAHYGITPHQKCKKISYNSHYKNAYVCPCTISAELYQLNPSKHITQ